jgi:hypothetical protein
MKYLIRDRETGSVIEDAKTKEIAQSILDHYESEDKKEGTYTPDFYEIIESEEECTFTLGLKEAFKEEKTRRGL